LKKENRRERREKREEIEDISVEISEICGRKKSLAP